MTNAWKRFLEKEEKDKIKSGFLLIEKLGLVYSFLTTILILALWKEMAAPWNMIGGRILILAATLLLLFLYRRFPYKALKFIRITFQMTLLNFWYPETYSFNCNFNNQDHIFARLEQSLFHCQPALFFGKLCPEKIFSEAFNLGYFSYYPMILVVMVFYFVYQYKEYEKASFIVMCSFLIYYIIYILIPVTGPQYYFQAIGYEWAKIGIFPEMGTYFKFHTDMFPPPGDPEGFFFGLVRGAQDIGEYPTAAFPSSHVSITTILLILSFKKSRTLGFCLLPIALLLYGATVYIQAHYVIDAVAGFITAFPVYFLTRYIYEKYRKQEEVRYLHIP